MHVLVVEDEKKTHEYLKKGLMENGFVVDVAVNGEDGLHLALTGTYDLIILDVMLPDRDGWSIVAEIRRNGKQTPVLFLTARDAVLVSSLIGPMQVVGRIAEFTFAHRLSPLSVGALAFGLMTAGLACLALIDGLSAMAFAFAVLYGWSNGVMTIVRGTVPAVLFGRRNYGALLGRFALPAFIAKAVAPVAFTLVFAASLSRDAALWALVLAAVVAQVAYRLATHSRRGR